MDSDNTSFSSDEGTDIDAAYQHYRRREVNSSSSDEHDTPKRARLEAEPTNIRTASARGRGKEGESTTRKTRGRGRGRGRGKGRGKGRDKGAEASSSQEKEREPTPAENNAGEVDVRRREVQRARGRRPSQVIRVIAGQSETEDDQPGPSSSRSTSARRGRGTATRKGARTTARRGAGSNSGGLNLRNMEADEDRVREHREKRKQKMKDDISKMSREAIENLLFKTIERRPGMVFDVMYTTQSNDGNPPHGSPPHDSPPHGTPPQEGLHWCRCGNCQEMPTDVEKLCCGNAPEDCLRDHAVFQMITDEVCLLLQRAMWVDAYNLEGEPQEPGEENRSMRHAAYRSYIFWQHGRLGQGNRRVIPSCCVTGIRRLYPSMNGQYTGYVPGRFV